MRADENLPNRRRLSTKAGEIAVSDSTMDPYLCSQKEKEEIKILKITVVEDSVFGGMSL